MSAWMETSSAATTSSQTISRGRSVSARVVPLPGAEREVPSPPARVPSLLLAGMESIGSIALVADDALQVLHANGRGLEAGVNIFRVHDVQANVRLTRMWEAMHRGRVQL